MTNLENLMIKGIQEFKRQYKGYEIRSCCVYENYGNGKKYSYALIHIEYVDKENNRYETEISVGAND